MFIFCEAEFSQKMEATRSPRCNNFFSKIQNFSKPMILNLLFQENILVIKRHIPECSQSTVKSNHLSLGTQV